MWNRKKKEICPRCLPHRIAGVLRTHGSTPFFKLISTLYANHEPKHSYWIPSDCKTVQQVYCARTAGLYLSNGSLISTQILNRTYLEPSPRCLQHHIAGILRTLCKAPPFKLITDFLLNTIYRKFQRFFNTKNSIKIQLR